MGYIPQAPASHKKIQFQTIQWNDCCLHNYGFSLAMAPSKIQTSLYEARSNFINLAG